MGWTVSALAALILIVIANVNVNVNVNAQRVQRGAVGGVPTELNEFPFMAALGWTNNETKRVDYLCGGALIAKNFVLTAAHCVFFGRERKLPNIIQVGGNNLNSTENEEHTVKAYFMHPQYNSTRAYGDIAILELDRNSTKTPVSLWTDPDLDTTDVVAIGYGTTEYAGSRTPILQKVELTITQQAECEPHFKRERKFPNGITSSQICAGDPDGKMDTCQGDSGGPLIVRKKFAAGIISTGQACSGNPPAVYTRISTFIDWIASILGEHGYERVDKTLDVKDNRMHFNI